MHFQKATDVEQNFAEAYFNLARLSFTPAEYEFAERNFETALEIKKDFDECHYFLGKLLAKGEKMTKDGTLLIEPQRERAANHFREALKINPDNYKSYYELGILLSQQEEYIEAFDALHKSIKINPEFADGHYELAVLLMNESAQTVISKRKK